MNVVILLLKNWIKIIKKLELYNKYDKIDVYR